MRRFALAGVVGLALALVLPLSAALTDRDRAGPGSTHLPFYLLAIQNVDSSDFEERWNRAYEVAEASIAAGEATTIVCLPPRGHGRVATVAACNRRPNHTIVAPGDACITGDASNVAQDAGEGQQERPDGSLAPRELTLERQFRRSGIHDKDWVEKAYDCEDFAYEGFLWLRKFYGDSTGFKTYNELDERGQKISGHALNYVQWEDGTRTYLEPQTGEVVELPKRRQQTFESTDRAKVKDWFELLTEIEAQPR